MTLAGLALLLLFAINVIRGWVVGDDGTTDTPAASQMAEAATAQAADAAVGEAAGEPAVGAGGAAQIDPSWHTQIGLPYDEYFLTQGTHGESYGHLAIDIAAGNGAVIKSIINGTVSGTGYDQWGNTFLQIENDVFSVLYLHGVYNLIPGDPVTIGQPIGTESNIGYTLDRAGNLCAGRDCGYHTHLNLYDKRIAANINPLSLIPANYP